MKTSATGRLRVTALPQLISGQDFGLSDVENNKKMLAELKSDPTFKQVKIGSTLLGQVSDRLGLTLFFENRSLIRYYVQVTKAQFSGIPNAVVQTAVWRTPASGVAPGLTSKVFNRLIEKYGAIVSDKLHTDRGRDFWIDQLALAFDHGRKVGFLNKGQLVEIDAQEDLSRYLDSKNFSYGWGDNAQFQNYRFVIFKEKRQ